MTAAASITPDKEPHPLTGNPKWLHVQPMMSVSFPYFVTPLPSGDPESKTLLANDTCRERLISTFRTAFQQASTQKEPVGPMEPWAWKRSPTATISFESKAKDPQIAKLSIHRGGYHLQAGRIDTDVDLFLQAVNAIVGTSCVLFDPTRPKGDWWRTPADKSVNPQNGEMVSWFGTTNFFAIHPVLTAIVLGLYRQAAILVSIGYGEKIVNAVPRAEIEAAITDCDWRKALANAEALRPWIEVPLPKAVGTNPFNFAFPTGYWRRYVRLHRALRRYGFGKVFGEDFCANWDLLHPPSKTITGLYTFWGWEGQYSEQHNALMRLGKPLKRKTASAEKSDT